LQLEVGGPADGGALPSSPEFIAPKRTMPMTLRTIVTVPCIQHCMRAEQYHVDETENYEVGLFDVWVLTISRAKRKLSMSDEEPAGTMYSESLVSPIILPTSKQVKPTWSEIF
jgi:hypothetical protein